MMQIEHAPSAPEIVPRRTSQDQNRNRPGGARDLRQTEAEAEEFPFHPPPQVHWPRVFPSL